MKHRHMLSLLQTGFTTVQVYFPNDLQSAPQVPAAPRAPMPAPAPWDNQPRAPQAPTYQPRLFTYKAELNTVKAGDMVIVESAKGEFGLTLARVETVDAAPQIDPDANFDYKWIVQVVDTKAYAAKREQETKFDATLLEVERAHQREELVAKMTAHLPVGSAARNMFDAAINQYAKPVALPVQAGGDYAPAFSYPTDTKTAAEPTVAGVQCK